MKIIALAAAALALAAPLRAIELSLEENRAARGSVGFVDMQRIFSESPDSARAKESFDTLVREAEERVNLKKAELVKLRQELSAAKAERERLSKSAAAVPPPPLISTAAIASVPPPPVSPRGAAPSAALPGLLPMSAFLAPPAASTATLAVSTSPASVAVSTGAAAVAVSTHAASVAVSTGAAVPAPAPAAVAASTSAAAVAVSTAAAPAAPPAAPNAAATGPSIAERVLDLDRKIVALQGDLTRKEEQYALERNETDRGLVSIEGRKTDQVLAHIYQAITVVARQEGLSIIVDKSAILYGHRGVDLTDKVLQNLRSAQP
jgi:Skp family chaperone for outer membrane proteins